MNQSGGWVFGGWGRTTASDSEQPETIMDKSVAKRTSTIGESKRLDRLRAVALFLIVVLIAKVLVTIVSEYRWYFPPNFDASQFLIGRRDFFHGLYRAAFYLHILAGPVAIVIGSALMVSGGRASFRHHHRVLGRIQGVIVIGMIAPSGLVMATRAFTGTVAGWGFALLALATAACMLAAVYHARRRQFAAHQRWAARCFVLLISPLLLRIMSGAAVVFEIDSHWTYPANAWLSWVLPLIAYELTRKFSGRKNRPSDHVQRLAQSTIEHNELVQ